MGAHGVCILTSKHQSCLTGGGCSNTCRWLLWVIRQPLPASFGRHSPGLAMPGAEGGDASVSSRHAELVPCSTQVSLGCWQTQLPFKVMRNSSSVCVLQKKDWSPELGMDLCCAGEPRVAPSPGTASGGYCWCVCAAGRTGSSSCSS